MVIGIRQRYNKLVEARKKQPNETPPGGASTPPEYYSALEAKKRYNIDLDPNHTLKVSADGTGKRKGSRIVLAKNKR